MTPRRPRRWVNSAELERELELLRIARVERRNEIARWVGKGLASPDELRQFLPPGAIGRVD